jgi:ABC-type nitrate/sulfonate/bicarbonate transport system substrate-binding protein
MSKRDAEHTGSGVAEPAAKKLKTTENAAAPSTPNSMVKLRVGGVPEHFNEPWMMAIERRMFADAGVDVEWVEQRLGTGAMLKALETGECDVVVALTEGIVSQIARGNEAGIRLVGSYVETPLCWAISTGANSAATSVADLRHKTFGVSRLTR